MKANKAPEKIYIQSFNVSEEDAKFDKSKMFFDDVWTEEPELGQENIEYTRTDYAEKEFLIKANRFLSEIHRVCDITDENGYRIELRDLQERFENFYKEIQNH